jgi:hypothetical protein
MSTYFHDYCKYFSADEGRNARAAVPPQSTAVSAIYGRRTVRNTLFLIQKKFGGGNLKK